jgi:hypothetical protein
VKSLSRSVLVHRTLSGGTLDSPVNYNEEFESIGPSAPDYVRWGTELCPVRQTRVLFGFFCSFLLNPNF